MEIIVTRARMRSMLWNWGHALNTISGYENDLKVLRQLIVDAQDTLGAQNLDGMPHSGAPGDSVARAVELVEKRKEAYSGAERATMELIEGRLRLKTTMDRHVIELSALEQQIIRLRYQEGKEWVYIALRVNYSEAQARAIETQAIDKLRATSEIKDCSAKLKF